MISWEEYIKSNISYFRKEFDKSREEWKRIVKTNKIAFLASLNSPCQVAVIDFGEGESKCLIVLHDQKHSDMEVSVFENVALEDFSSGFLKNIELLGSIQTREFQEIVDFVKSIARGYFLGYWVLFNKTFVCVVGDIRPIPRLLSEKALEKLHIVILSIDKKEYRRQLEEAIKSIKEYVEAIPVSDLRTKILDATAKLESQIHDLDKRLQEEVGGVRRLIGTSERFLEFRAFASEFEQLKETHIARETFETHIKRLDEKIETMKESLNTRIEDLKAIKFWSKRTLLEIALSIIAVIATLYGVGALDFLFSQPQMNGNSTLTSYFMNFLSIAMSLL